MVASSGDDIHAFQPALLHAQEQASDGHTVGVKPGIGPHSAAGLRCETGMTCS